ncbi:MAG TPA: VWA domain-containing protein [bacterium]|nr:VWA domain-containing protein [bacterium]HPS29223.1 VWA domain-containing protein [bacterium]
MQFLSPYWLLLSILIIPAAYLHLRLKGSSGQMIYSNFRNLRNRASWKFLLPGIIDAVAILVAIVALARPVSLEKTVTPPIEGKDIIVALDISGSMEALDFQPKNRIEAAKKVIESFVKGRSSDRLGLVFFAKESFLQVPLTTDYDVFIELLSRLKTGVIEDGTAIGNGLGLALSKLSNSKAKSRVIIILTDGDSNAGNLSPETAAEMAAKEGVKIYSILIGTDKAVPFPTGKDFFGNDTFQNIQMKTNPGLLKKISEKSGGKFYQSISTDQLKKAFKDIDELEKSPVPARKLKIYNEYAPYFILFSILLLCLARFAALIFKLYPEVER